MFRYLRLISPLAIAFVLCGETGSKNDAAAPWPQWRGPQRDGVSPGAPWPEQLTGLRRAWRVELDKGYSGPILAADRVFVTETSGGDTEIVRALDRRTGRELWRASWKGKISVPFFAKKQGDWIRSTPAYDGRTLFAGGMEEVLVALDGQTGKELWRVDFPQRFSQPKPDFGFASSPLLDGEFLYVQAANSLVKIRKSDGSTVWRALEHRGDIMESGAFSSPVIATLAGKRQIVVGTRTALAGVDPENGKTLWQQEVPNFRGMNILTPVVHGDTVFTSTYRMDSYLFRIEAGENGAFRATELWRNKAKGYMASPVLSGGHIYLHLGNQRFTCLDLQSGETKWTSEPLGQYWSMALRGDKILGLDEAGKLYLVRVNPSRFDVLDSREVSESSAWAHLAVAGNELYVRDLTGITGWVWEKAPATPVSSASAAAALD